MHALAKATTPTVNPKRSCKIQRRSNEELKASSVFSIRFHVGRSLNRAMFFACLSVEENDDSKLVCLIRMRIRANLTKDSVPVVLALPSALIRYFSVCRKHDYSIRR